MTKNFDILLLIEKIFKNKWFRLISGLAILVFIFLYFKSVGGEFQQLVQITSPIFFLYATPFLLIALITHALAWRLIVNHFGTKLNVWDSIYIYYYSNLTRYIPGNYWHFIFKSTMGVNFGIDLKTGLKGTGIELILNVLVGFVFVVLGIIFKFVKFEKEQIVWLLLFLLVSLFALIIFFIISQRSKNSENTHESGSDKRLKIKEEVSEILTFSKREIVTVILLFSSAWLAQGLTFYFVLSAWEVTSISYYAAIMFSYVAAWFMGFINPIAQNGLGVREATSVVTLSNIFEVSTILGANLAMRVIGLLGELFLLVVSWLIRSKSNKAMG